MKKPIIMTKFFETNQEYFNFITRVSKITTVLGVACLFNKLRNKTIVNIIDQINDALIVIATESESRIKQVF